MQKNKSDPRKSNAKITPADIIDDNKNQENYDTASRRFRSGVFKSPSSMAYSE